MQISSNVVIAVDGASSCPGSVTERMTVGTIQMKLTAVSHICSVDSQLGH